MPCLFELFIWKGVCQSPNLRIKFVKRGLFHSSWQKWDNIYLICSERRMKDEPETWLSLDLIKSFNIIPDEAIWRNVPDKVCEHWTLLSNEMMVQMSLARRFCWSGQTGTNFITQKYPADHTKWMNNFTQICLQKLSLFYDPLFPLRCCLAVPYHFENIHRNIRNNPFAKGCIVNQGIGFSRSQRKCMLPLWWYRRGCILQFHKQSKVFKFHEKTRTCRVVVFILNSSSLTL